MTVSSRASSVNDLTSEEMHSQPSKGINTFYETCIGIVLIPHSILASGGAVSM